jgi:hypothetical protein
MIRGEARPSRLKDDRPKIDAPPELPPGTVLSESERAMFDWLLRTVYVPGVHGASDGAAFVKVARLWPRLMEADAKIATHGMLMRDPRGNKVMLQPYTRLSRDLWRQLGIALAEIGATPAGRVKLAAPRSKQHAAADWDGIE